MGRRPNPPCPVLYFRFEKEGKWYYNLCNGKKEFIKYAAETVYCLV